MALDSLTLNAGTGGQELSCDTMAGGERVQYVKLIDGTAASEVPVYADNGVAANSLRVTLASDSSGQVKLAAGSATCGKFNVGTFDTASTTSPATLEDSASSAGEMILKVGGIRKDTDPATTTGANSDWEGLQLCSGAVWVTPRGDIADDAALVTKKPVQIGGWAVATDGTTPTTVSEGDLAQLRTDLSRRLLVSETHPYLWSASVDYGASAQNNATVKAAPGASLSLYITDVLISNGPTAVNNVTLLDGSGGTVMLEAYMAQNANMTFNLRTPIRLTANTLLAVTSTGATEMSITVSGYIGP